MLTYKRITLLSSILILSLFSSVEANAPVVLNELMASNSNCLQDPQGQYDDWMEIHNYGTSPIDIGGMYLTDDLSVTDKWRIPSTTIIPAGGYLLIWADNDTGDTGLHANFQLDNNGEEIGLIDSDGETLIDSIIFPDQTTDISYGRFPDATGNWSFLAIPTPGTENNDAYSGKIKALGFSHESGAYNTPFSVTIDTETEGVEIYYSVDGSEPYRIGTRGSIVGTVYTEPVPISNTTCLRAQAIKPGWLSAGIESRQFIFFEPDVRNFSSNLPIAIVDTFGEGISQYRQTFTITGFFDTSTEGRAVITDSPEFIDRAGINIRGKSSAGWPKKQYHLETWDEYDNDKDVSILGFQPESDWVLQGPYSDKSLMRNVLSYKWSNDMGQYAVRTRFIEMFLNTGGGPISMSDYVGVYVFMEKIKRNRNRVNITKLEPADNAEPEVTGGYILKIDKLDADDRTFHTDIGVHLTHVDPNGADITPQQMFWIQDYIRDFESVLFGPNFADTVDGYAGYIDIDSFIDHHILVELTKNIDGFRLSTYMFKDRGGKLNMGPVWDYNLSLGNANYYDGWNSQGWYHEVWGLWTPGGEGYPSYEWYRRLFEDPEFELRYWDRWYALRKGVYSTEKLLGDIDTYNILLDEAQVRNFARWNILGRYLWPNWFIAYTHQAEIDWMKQWLESRLVWIDGQFSAPPVFSRDGGQVSNGFNLTIDSPTGTIYYTLDDSDPRLTGGAVSPAALNYTITGPVTLDESTIVKARVMHNRWWSALNEAVFAVRPVANNLRITEILYYPQSITGQNDPNEGRKSNFCIN